MSPSAEADGAADVCPRCGARAALRSLGRRRRLCTRCLDRTRSPIERAPVTTRALLAGVGELLSTIGPRLALTVLLVQAPLALVIVLADVPPTAVSLYGLVTLLGTGAVIDQSLAALGAERPSLGASLRWSAGAWLGLIAVELFGDLIILAWSLLLLVPGILRALSYALALPLIIDGEAHGVDALELSRKRMRGHRRQALGAYLVCLLPVLLALGLYLGIATHVSDASVGTLLAGQMPADYPPALRLVDGLDALLYPLFDLPVVLTAVVLHVKLRRPGR